MSPYTSLSSLYITIEICAASILATLLESPLFSQEALLHDLGDGAAPALLVLQLQEGLVQRVQLGLRRVVRQPQRRQVRLLRHLLGGAQRLALPPQRRVRQRHLLRGGEEARRHLLQLLLQRAPELGLVRVLGWKRKEMEKQTEKYGVMLM